MKTRTRPSGFVSGAQIPSTPVRNHAEEGRFLKTAYSTLVRRALRQAHVVCNLENIQKGFVLGSVTEADLAIARKKMATLDAQVKAASRALSAFNQSRE